MPAGEQRVACGATQRSQFAVCPLERLCLLLGTLAHLQRDQGHRHRLLRESQDLLERGGGLDGARNDRMVAVYRVYDLASSDELAPDECALTAVSAGDLLASVPVDLDGTPTGDLTDLSEPVAKRPRGPRCR